MNNEKLKVLYVGTSDFGVPALKELIKINKYEIGFVVTLPDKKTGRKQYLTPSPIKDTAIANNLAVLQPDNLLTIIDDIKEYAPDIIIVISYSKLIPKEILDLPKHGCINVHASLLPKYRGASCVQAAILNGDKETGLTIIKMDKNLDTGPILNQMIIAISHTDNSRTLSKKLSISVPDFLTETIEEYLKGNLFQQIQPLDNSSFVYTLKRKDGKINWQNNAENIERFIRGMYPWPGAFSMTPKKSILKIISVDNNILPANEHEPGKLFLHDKKLAIQCGKGSLIIKKIQPEGKTELEAHEFINGYKQLIGQILV
jgi:methionyl-tRNA formyltransferase